MRIWKESAEWTAGKSMNGIDLKSGRNGEAPAVELNSGIKLPVVGLGTYALRGSVCADAVCAALRSGYRLIDTASFYGNEREVGEGIRKSGVPRSEVFVQTKLYPTQYGRAAHAIDEALERLDVGYIDMMLLHHPASNDAEAYRAIEGAIRKGDVRTGGISCFYIRETDAFLPQVSIEPDLVQNEIHPYYQDIQASGHIQNLGLVVQAWYPLGGRGYTEAMFGDSVLCQIAREHGKSVSQVILRWLLQRGIAVIPGSSNPGHIRENISLFDFELSPDEMGRIAGLERREKHDWY